jgi:hypothetical protein
MKTKAAEISFKVGDSVVDGSGYHGIVIGVTHRNGSHWYDVRFDRGDAVRYDNDLRMA